MDVVKLASVFGIYLLLLQELAEDLTFQLMPENKTHTQRGTRRGRAPGFRRQRAKPAASEVLRAVSADALRWIFSLAFEAGL